MTTDHVTVAILGAGSWGTTFAKVLADAAHERGETIDIRLWARRDEVVDDINNNHTNTEYLEDIVLPETIRATSDAEAAVGAGRSSPTGEVSAGGMAELNLVFRIRDARPSDAGTP